MNTRCAVCGHHVVWHYRVLGCTSPECTCSLTLEEALNQANQEEQP